MNTMACVWIVVGLGTLGSDKVKDLVLPLAGYESIREDHR